MTTGRRAHETSAGYPRLYLVGQRTVQTFAAGPWFFQDPQNSLILSVASVWEMQVKLQLGKLKLTLPLETLIEGQRRTNNLEILPVMLAHVLALQNLPAHHKDPFDRLLIAQANSEDASVVTNDPVFSKYTDKVLW